MQKMQPPDSSNLQEHSLKIIVQNVQSIANKVLQLSHFLKKQNPDYLLVCEHWQTDDEINMICLNDYKLCASICKLKKKHGGVAIFRKSDIKCKTLTVMKNFSLLNIFECCAMEAESDDVVIITIYRFPSGTSSENELFLEKFDAMCKYFCRSRKQVVICGDFNIEFNNKSANSREFFDLLNVYNFNIGTTKPTRASSCIDNILINKFVKQ